VHPGARISPRTWHPHRTRCGVFHGVALVGAVSALPNMCCTHRSMRDLNADIRAWIKTWNDNPGPYEWAKTADQILDSIARYCIRINDSRP
jgi:hypothetical protein